MRSLPDTCVHWSSAEGRRRYAEALRGGTLEAHLTLAAHFRTQSELVYCGQGTLAMALSALAPPLGGARWSEGSMVDCCRPREEVLTRGISLDTFACLARCCGVSAEATRAPPLPALGPATRAAEAGAADGLRALRAAVAAACGDAGGRSVLVGSYSREALGQTGNTGVAAVGLHSGHYSPVGGYHEGTDSVLLLDVARFKYPPHWVALGALFRAMRFPDPETGLPRGFVVLRASPVLTLLRVALGQGGLCGCGGGGSGGGGGGGGGGVLMRLGLGAPPLGSAGGSCGGHGGLWGTAAAAAARAAIPALPPGGGRSPHALVDAWVRGMGARGAAPAVGAAPRCAHPAAHWVDDSGGVASGVHPSLLRDAAAFLPTLEASPLYALVASAAEREWLPRAAGGTGAPLPLPTLTNAHTLTLLLLLRAFSDAPGAEGAEARALVELARRHGEALPGGAALFRGVGLGCAGVEVGVGNGA
jgi:glutathione gamma-glutamylcysteinyltransferase